MLLHAPVHGASGFGEVQAHSAAIVGIGAALHQTPVDQRLDDAGDLRLVATGVGHQVALRDALMACQVVQRTGFHDGDAVTVFPHRFMHAAVKACDQAVQRFQNVGRLRSFHDDRVIG